jgi:hypothetical protein
MALMIDPPSGWRYGFPKPIPEERKNDSLVWLVEQGYPKHLIDELGEHFYCRYWETDEIPFSVNDCYFQPNDNNSSMTICVNCGKEKFLHKK